MTALPLRDFTDAERNRLAVIEAAPAAEESVRERVAVALFEVTEAAEYDEWPDVTGAVQIYVYALADAALDVLGGPSSEAEQAVERVLALAQNYQAAADEAAEAAQGQLPDVVEYYRRVTIAGYGAADRIRAAVAGPPC